MLEESMVTLSNILSARFVDNIRSDVEVFYRKMQYLENLIAEWQVCQKSWMYLENIFNGSDIAKTMGQDSKKFQQIDQFWKEFMKATHNNPTALKLLSPYKD